MLRWLATRAENQIIDQIVARKEIDFTPEEEKMICKIYRRRRAPMTSEGNTPEPLDIEACRARNHRNLTDAEIIAEHEQHVEQMRRAWGEDGRRNPDSTNNCFSDEGVLLSNAVRELH